MDYETSLKNPVTVTLVNKTPIIQTIRYFKVNLIEKLNPEDSIIITATTSEELAYYNKLQKDLEDSTGVITPMEYANIIYNNSGKTVLSCEIDGNFEDRVDYTVKVDNGEEISEVTMSIYYEDQIVTGLYDGTDGPYAVSGTYYSTTTYVTRQGVIIGHKNKDR